MAFAAVISLKNAIQRLNPTHLPITNSLNCLRDILERLDDTRNRSAINALDAEIRDAAWKLEDVLQSYALNHSLPPSENGWPSIDDKGVEQEMASFFLTTNKLKDIPTPSKPLALSLEEDDHAAVSPTHDFGGNESTTIGLWDQFEEIRNEILDGTSGLKAVSLVGMAGIGKTHLAREVFSHPIIVQHFNLTAWVSVGLKDQIKNALVDIISQVKPKPRNVCVGESMSRLMELLQNCLNGRRYLIVLDDIWSTQVFDFLMKWLPPYGKQRRLLVTTRLHEVAKHCSSTRTNLIRFLNNEESWNLLWQNVFVGSSFPPQLEKVGRKIAENCEGLPLLILAVADILRGLDKTEGYWKKVADRKTTTFPDAYDQISKVLSSSYDYLSQQLKVCFLYMGVFPQSCEIPLPKLIHLWTIEDLIESNQSETLDDFAMECLKELVSNSLVFVCKQSSSYRIKSSKLHSAYWYLCVKEARNNKFFHVLNKLTDGSKDYIERQRRLSVQNNILFGIKEVHDSMADTLTARSLLCTGEDQQYPVPICFNLMLLRVLDALSIRLYEFPGEVVKLLLLRYLALTHNGKVPSSISKLQQLQCLIVRQHHNIKFLGDSGPKKWWYTQGQRSTKLLRDSTCLPNEIWDVRELRHLQILGSNLPDPSYRVQLPNLLTLYVNAHSCTKAVFRSIPCLKKLGIKIELQPDSAETLSCFEHIRLLRRLESLKCVIVNPRLRAQVVAPPGHLSNLPRGLKKLSLNGLGYSWKYMSAIGSLPNLQVLKLRCSAFQGPEWETEVGEFPSLEFLLLEDIDLVHWTIYDDEWFPRLQRLICNGSYFPRLQCLNCNDRWCFSRLQHLSIQHCYKLKEIPCQIGDVPTLKTMEVVDCSPSVVASALQLKQIKSSLQVVINSSWNLRR